MQIEIIYAAIITGIATVIGALVGIFGKPLLVKLRKQDKDAIRENIKDIALIEMELYEIREILNADRVWISQFHNGGNFYPTGKSIQKFSVFYEVDAKNVSPVAHLFTNIPCSLYPKLFSSLMSDGGVRIPSFSTDAEKYGLEGAAESVGTVSSYIAPLYSINEKYIGNMGVDYIGEEIELSDEEWNILLQRASRLAGYLSNYLNKK